MSNARSLHPRSNASLSGSTPTGLNKPNPPFEPAKDRKGGIYVLTP
jgi:hypothetical protein